MLELFWARGQRGRWSRTRRERSRLRIETELLFPHADHVGAREDALPLYLLFVDERAVGAGVDHDVTPGRVDDLRMPAGHVLPGNDDVATGFTPEHERRARDHVLAPVREADHPATGRPDGRGLPAWSGRRARRPLGQTQGLHVLRAPGAALVHEGELVVAHLDFVAVQQGGRLGTQAHAVDEHVGRRRGLADDHLAVGLPLEHGMPRQHACPREGDGAAGITAEHHLTHRDGELVATEFKQRHLRRKLRLAT